MAGEYSSYITDFLPANLAQPSELLHAANRAEEACELSWSKLVHAEASGCLEHWLQGLAAGDIGAVEDVLDQELRLQLLWVARHCQWLRVTELDGGIHCGMRLPGGLGPRGPVYHDCC